MYEKGSRPIMCQGRVCRKPVILALRRLWQEASDFKATLGYIARFHIKPLPPTISN